MLTTAVLYLKILQFQDLATKQLKKLVVHIPGKKTDSQLFQK